MEGLLDVPIKGYRDAKWTSSSSATKTQVPNSLWIRGVMVRKHQGAQPHLIHCKTFPCQERSDEDHFHKGKDEKDTG